MAIDLHGKKKKGRQRKGTTTAVKYLAIDFLKPSYSSVPTTTEPSLGQKSEMRLFNDHRLES
jgi:hypothetical protein